MAKLTKQQLRLHKRALKILEKDELSDDDRWFVLENWRPSALSVAENDAYFTPHSIAQMFAMDVMEEGRILDLCAGIGMLSYHVWRRGYIARYQKNEFVAVETNPAYVAVGEKLLPWVTWIQGDIFDPDLWEGMGRFDQVICNPPFGSRKNGNGLRYKGPASLQAIEVAMRVSDSAVFILPQGQCPFQYARRLHYKEVTPPAVTRRFMRLYPEIKWSVSNFSQDIGDDFADTGITVEIVHLNRPLAERQRLLEGSWEGS
jgi:predicted RNA methylase